MTDEAVGEPHLQTQRLNSQPINLNFPALQHRRLSNPYVPPHLLHQSLATSLQVRHYSSDSQKGPIDPIQPQSTPENADSSKSQPISGFASAFGFQSLKNLFSEPPQQNRYSRSQEPNTAHERTPSSEFGDVDAHPQAINEGTQFRPFPSHFTPNANAIDLTSPDIPKTRAPGQSSKALSNSEPKQVVENGGITIRRVDAPLVPPRGSTLKYHWYGRRLPLTAENHVPWGVSQESPDKESISDESHTKHQSSQKEPLTPVVYSGQMFQDPTQDLVKETETKMSPQSEALTHVNSSGEVRMVDVGAKPATRRIAIAGAYVRFSNSEPLRLILENSNKKGDVLGTARIAGIMGAKRTSELIPLCHPISISKIDVDVKIHTVGLKSPLFAVGKNVNGAVQIEALVETVGPTGVEMEALAAANIAALTVVDMCKAVDRAICIQASQVVYKSGGKSGTYSQTDWVQYRGREYFEERGLEYPRKTKGSGKKGPTNDSSKNVTQV